MNDEPAKYVDKKEGLRELQDMASTKKGEGWVKKYLKFADKYTG